MKKNNIIIFKLVLIALLIAMIATFTHCVPQSANEVGNGSMGEPHSTSYTGPPAPKDEGQIINAIQVSTGVKNHEQILHTMGAVTGIDPYTNNSIIGIYRQVATSLPTENDIKVFSATQQVAITKLAAEFCFHLTQGNYATQRAAIWPGLNLSVASGTAFNEVNELVFIDQTINAFWGGVLSDEELDVARQELSMLIEQLISDQNTAAATQRTVRGTCTAALSSAYVTLL
jgi:hypothetical protein